MDNRLRAFLLVYLLIRMRRRRARRRFREQPIVARRHLEGEFVRLFSELRKNYDNFFDYFKMSIKTFDELHDKLKPHITHSDINRTPISSTERLAVTIRYLTTGTGMSDLHLSYRLGMATVKYIIQEVCSKIWEVVGLPESDLNFWQNKAVDFEKKSNMPNCIGAIGAKKTLIKVNNKSIALVAMSDANSYFTYVHVKVCDTETDPFKGSSLFAKLEKNHLQLPPPRLLSSESVTDPLPYVIVAGENFGTASSILRSYVPKHLDEKKKIFNLRVGQARIHLVRTLGLLTHRFKIFHRPINASENFGTIIVKACCVLHNFITIRDGFVEEDSWFTYGIVDDWNEKNRIRGKSGDTLRDLYANYFISSAMKSS